MIALRGDPGAAGHFFLMDLVGDLGERADLPGGEGVFEDQITLLVELTALRVGEGGVADDRIGREVF